VCTVPVLWWILRLLASANERVEVWLYFAYCLTYLP